MKKYLVINNKINAFNKSLNIPSDKSLSIRCILFASLASGKSNIINILESDDIKSTIGCVQKFGIKIKKKNKGHYEVFGNGIKGYKYKKGISINAGNSGTLARLILGCLIDSPHKIKLMGDQSLSKRDFTRVLNPLKKIGLIFGKKKSLPLMIKGTSNPKPIRYHENQSSAQVKTCLMLAAIKTNGRTIIIAKKSRTHSEILFKELKIPIKIKSTQKRDIIEILKTKKISSFTYKLPGDISSASFFIVLTLLTNNAKLTIKNVNINPTRTGIITILNKMGAKIRFRNKKIYKGELIANIEIKSIKNLKNIKLPQKFNSSAIDEFLLIFLVAAKAKGVSIFKGLSELDKKESPRLKWSSKILNYMGVKNILTKNSIKIYGNPSLKLNKTITIKNFLKDHRVFMMSTIAALTCGGRWIINNPDSISTSFPSFIKKVKELGGKIN